MSSQKTFVAALSGGVDSSVAAAIFVKEGHKIIGATLKMKNCDDTKEKTKACCGLDDNIQARLAADKAGENAKGSVLASDAYFPFTDAVEIAIKSGVAAIIQPGGSVHDKDVIEFCNKNSIPMVFTGKRHFKH